MGYVSKLTSAGQITIPRMIRERLGPRGPSFVILDGGDVVLPRPFEAAEETPRILRKSFLKTGLTRARVKEIIERERAKFWKETAQDLR